MSIPGTRPGTCGRPWTWSRSCPRLGCRRPMSGWRRAGGHPGWRLLTESVPAELEHVHRESPPPPPPFEVPPLSEAPPQSQEPCSEPLGLSRREIGGIVAASSPSAGRGSRTRGRRTVPGPDTKPTGTVRQHRRPSPVTLGRCRTRSRTADSWTPGARLRRSGRHRPWRCRGGLGIPHPVGQLLALAQSPGQPPAATTRASPARTVTSLSCVCRANSAVRPAPTTATATPSQVQACRTRSGRAANHPCCTACSDSADRTCTARPRNWSCRLDSSTLARPSSTTAVPALGAPWSPEGCCGAFRSLPA